MKNFLFDSVIVLNSTYSYFYCSFEHWNTHFSCCKQWNHFLKVRVMLVRKLCVPGRKGRDIRNSDYWRLFAKSYRLFRIFRLITSNRWFGCQVIVETLVCIGIHTFICSYHRVFQDYQSNTHSTAVDVNFGFSLSGTVIRIGIHFWFKFI